MPAAEHPHTEAWQAWRRQRAYLRACLYIAVKQYLYVYPLRAPLLVPVWGAVGKADTPLGHADPWEPAPIPNVIAPVIIGDQEIAYRDQLGMRLRWRKTALITRPAQPGDPRYRGGLVDQPAVPTRVWDQENYTPAFDPAKRTLPRRPTRACLIRRLGFARQDPYEQDLVIADFTLRWNTINHLYIAYLKLGEMPVALQNHYRSATPRLGRALRLPLLPDPLPETAAALGHQPRIQRRTPSAVHHPG